MTENDKASDPFLTEEANAPGKARAPDCSACYAMKLYGHCYFACTKGISCPCVYHRQCWVETLREEGFENTPAWHRAIERLTRAQKHLEISTDHEERRAKEALHRQNKANAKSELGPREFTLTFSPGTHYPDDESAKGAMTAAIERLTRYYRNEIIEFHAVGEYTAAGRPHIHGWYHLSGGRKITDKNFRRAYPPWNPKRKLGKGFEGGHHQTIERVSDFAGYAEKHLEEAWHVTNITNADEPPNPETA